MKMKKKYLKLNKKSSFVKKGEKIILSIIVLFYNNTYTDNDLNDPVFSDT